MSSAARHHAVDPPSTANSAPVCTELTRTPYPARSRAEERVSPRNPNFVEPYAACPRIPTSPAVDDTFTEAEGWSSAVAAGTEAFGRPAALVNNAALWRTASTS
jgi:hypothetical protein